MPTWPTTRPATISELAAAAASSSSCAKGSNCSASSTSNSADVGLNLELAFIEYAHAATLIMKMIPAHRDSQFGRGREGVDGGAEGESYCARGRGAGVYGGTTIP